MHLLLLPLLAALALLPACHSSSSSGGDDDTDSDTLDCPDAGGFLSWVVQAGGDSDDSGHSIAAFEDGSFVVTGNFSFTAKFGIGEPNHTVLTAVPPSDIFVARYQPDGSLMWAVQAGGSWTDDWGTGDTGKSIAALPGGASLVTGFFIVEATFGAGEANETTFNAGGKEVFVARFEPDGTLDWVVRAGGEGDDRGQGIAALADGSALVTGYFSGEAVFGSGEPGETVLTAAGEGDGEDIFVARYDPETDRPSL
jgi:hypothetical protein